MLLKWTPLVIEAAGGHTARPLIAPLRGGEALVVIRAPQVITGGRWAGRLSPLHHTLHAR